MKHKLSVTKTVSWMVFFLVILYTFIFSFIAYLKYISFSFHDIDLAIINQAFWNTLKGRIVAHFLGGATILNGGHVFLIIFILVPLYAVFPSPLTLLILQTLALAIGAWPIYLIAKDLIKPSFGLLFAACYLIYPALNYVNLFEFHVISLATPLLLFMFLFYIRRKWWLFLLFMVLSLFCREDIAIPVFAIGFFALIETALKPPEERRKNLKWWLVPLISSLVWFFLCIKFIQPHFMPSFVKEAGEVKAGIGPFYSWIGTSEGGILKNVFSHPQLGVLRKPKLLYLFHLFIPLGFMSLFSPSALIMVLISLTEGMLSSRFTHFSIRYQYSSIITPLIFISAIFGVRNLLRWRVMAGKEKFILIVIVGFSLVSAKTIGPLFNLPEGMRIWKVTQEDRIRQRLVEEIPAHAPVIATFEFAPKLSMRPRLFYFYHVYSVSRHPEFRIHIPAAQKESRYALIDFNDWLTFYDFYTPGGDRDVDKFLSEGNWGLVETVNSIALFKKGGEAKLGLIEKASRQSPHIPLNTSVLPQMRLAGYNLNETEVLGARVISLQVYLRCLNQIPGDFLLSTRFTSRQAPEFYFQQAFFAPYRIYPTSRWQPGETVKQECNILIPERAPSGDYDLTLALLFQKGRGFEGKVIYRKQNALYIKEQN